MEVVKVFSIGFLIILISFISFGIFHNFFNNQALEKEILSHLDSVSKSKANRVSSFLDERKDDLNFIANSEDIIKLFETGGDRLDSEIVEKLNFYQKTNNYLDFILIGVDSKVIWSGKNEYPKGTILTSEYYNKTKLAEIYYQVRKDFGVGIFDPGYYGSENLLSVFVTTPILVDSKTIPGKKDIIGLLALQIDNSQIENKVQNDVGLGDYANIYLVSRDGTPITNLVYNGQSVSKLNNQITKDCFNNYNNYYVEKSGLTPNYVPSFGNYFNHENKEVFAAHHYILRSGWCVVSEIDKQLYYEKIDMKKEVALLFLLVLLISMLFLNLFNKNLKITRGGKK